MKLGKNTTTYKGDKFSKLVISKEDSAKVVTHFTNSCSFNIFKEC